MERFRGDPDGVAASVTDTGAVSETAGTRNGVLLMHRSNSVFLEPRADVSSEVWIPVIIR